MGDVMEVWIRCPHCQYQWHWDNCPVGDLSCLRCNAPAPLLEVAHQKPAWWVEDLDQRLMDHFHPIATVPYDVHHIEGSDNGSQFSHYYTRVTIDGKTYWREFSDLPGGGPIYEGVPKFWRRMRNFHGRDISGRWEHQAGEVTK